MTTPSGKRYIGVLGGMGPEATVLLMSRVIAMTPANDDRDHVPMLVDNNTQVPSRIKAILEKTGDNPGPVLVSMARRLADAGVAALAMPCNTAHHYAPLLVEAVPIPLLDMVKLSAGHIAAMAQPFRTHARRRVGMLASPAVRIAGIFDNAFAAGGLEAVYPADSDRLLACIKAIKANSSDPASRTILHEAALELLGAGAEVLLIACSELSLIADTVPHDAPVVDTIDVLAAAVVAFSTGSTSDEFRTPIENKNDRAQLGQSARRRVREVRSSVSPEGDISSTCGAEVASS